MKSVLIAIAIVLVCTGCVTVAPMDQIPTPSVRTDLVIPAITPEPTPSPTPTASPSPKPTPSPSPTRTPTPTLRPVTPPPSNGFADFYIEEQAVVQEMKDEVSGVNKHTSTAQLIAVGNDMANTGNNAMTWMNSHPADPCYQTAQDDLFTLASDWALVGIEIGLGEFASATRDLDGIAAERNTVEADVAFSLLACPSTSGTSS